MEGIGLVFPLRSSIKKTEQFKSVFNGVLGIVLIICLLFGSMSYTAFGVNTPEIIFLAFGPKYEYLFFLELLYATVSPTSNSEVLTFLGNFFQLHNEPPPHLRDHSREQELLTLLQNNQGSFRNQTHS